MPVRSCIIALFVVTSMAAAAPVGTARSEETRPQHREWIRKLETPGGTFSHAFSLEDDRAEPSALESNGTAMQHRIWLRKLETPGGTLGPSF
jgi:hypothetical protein